MRVSHFSRPCLEAGDLSSAGRSVQVATSKSAATGSHVFDGQCCPMESAGEIYDELAASIFRQTAGDEERGDAAGGARQERLFPVRPASLRIHQHKDVSLTQKQLRFDLHTRTGLILSGSVLCGVLGLMAGPGVWASPTSWKLEACRGSSGLLRSHLQGGGRPWS
ncbi:uncharacterized protein si:dkey-206f10.1 isoform X2 [Kryptolebias marmoratus]|uniref:uncharacterized protein si:dkey-206f10.1 isoform X2 n=1 Tax=Kryptolebias marmoratus TaxID=37003 RepID=UPI0018ACA584|nr:uncharacterized protein si:dkey-206f10.1 isoform X2 [Kryptolebias marmoratus]